MMRLLILTQTMDRSDPVLGFFHAWVTAFSAQFEKITVLCLEKGVCELPPTVTVHSLGKEKASSKFQVPSLVNRLQYALRFYRLIFRERKHYDAVFVHMNQEYVLLGGLFWRLWGKKVFLWYNHTDGGLLTRVSAHIAHQVFHTSPFAFTARFKNAQRMPAGIDVEKFKNQKSKIKNDEKEKLSILYVGRISPVKKVDILVRAAGLLEKRGISFTLDIYGDAPERDKAYYNEVQHKARELLPRGQVRFFKGVPNEETPAIYREHDVFVNLTPSGNYDKTVLEAASCGTLVVLSSEAFRDMVPELLYCKENDPESLAETLARVAALFPKEKEAYAAHLREYVVVNHDLEKLAESIRQSAENGLLKA